MKKKILTSIILIPLISSLSAKEVDLSQVKALGGEQGNACGALLCLAGGMTGGACAPYIARYFAIKLSKPWKTAQARREFLALCPTASVPSGNDKEFSQWQNDILPNIEGACTKEELNRDEKSKKPIKEKYEENEKGEMIKVGIFGYRINPNPTNSCNLLMQHNYYSKKISYTCSKDFYEEEDWFNGYTKEEISQANYNTLSEDLRGTFKRRLRISYSQYLKLPADERDVRVVSNTNNNIYYKLETIYFKKHFIKKDCWLVEDKIVAP